MEPPLKRTLMNKKIGTHNGTFHCDEALACFMLKLLPEYQEYVIERTRDQAVLDTCDIVVDVGGVYDPDTHRYDHHQRTFSKTMHQLRSDKPWVTKLSSAGLVYCHFGHRVISHLINSYSDDKIVDIIFDKVYENLIEEVDGMDNGINAYEGTPKYRITTTLSSRVGFLNPSWNAKSQDTDHLFMKAMELTGSELKDRVKYYTEVWWPARELVQAAVRDRHKVDESVEIIQLGASGCPWKDHLFDLEKEQQLEKSIKFVLFTDQNKQWRVQAVNVFPGSFDLRLPLCESWQGLRDDHLSSVSGISGCVFVHSSGFIGGNNTMEGALEMARKSLKENTFKKAEFGNGYVIREERGDSKPE